MELKLAAFKSRLKQTALREAHQVHFTPAPVSPAVPVPSVPAPTVPEPAPAVPGPASAKSVSVSA